MKLIFKIATFCLVIFYAGACIKDPCQSIFCNDGECINGTCNCDDGFTNIVCSANLASIATGNYTVFSSCDKSFFIFNDSINIAANTTLNTNKGITINNLIQNYPNYKLNAIIATEDSLYFNNVLDSIIVDSLVFEVFTDTVFVPTDTIYLPTDTIIEVDTLVNLVDSIVYRFKLIEANGFAWRDKFNENINLQINYTIVDSLAINDSLVICSQLFVKD